MARMTCGLGLLLPIAAAAQDRAELDRSRIVGNRELPKVIHIVPWKKPLPDELSGKPVGSVLDEVLAPVDRDVHRRQVAYHAVVAGAVPPAPVAPAGLAPLSRSTPAAPAGLAAAPGASASAWPSSPRSAPPSTSPSLTPPQEKKP